ncbi:DNA polymerase III subunit beta [Nocardia aobensis]|uniref:DNA polymerase III subunit beta n=1 Tax=Nocardia aobensis TaxID=257277 RepID=A0ABW6P5T3_9NOCA
MHITVSAADLLSGATATLAAVPSKPPHPILGAIVLDTAEDSTLQLSGFDYTTSARMRMPVQVLTPGKVAVSGRLLAQVAKLLPAKKNVTLMALDSQLVVQTDRASFSLPLLDVRDFPRLPQPESSAFTVDPKDFAAAVTWAASAALSDTDGRAGARPGLTAISLTARPNVLDIEATDGNRIHSVTIGLDAGPDLERVSALVPTKVLETTASAIGAHERLGLHLGDTVTIAGDRLIRTTPVIDAEFPPVHKIFDKEPVGTVYVSVAELAGALKRAATLSKTKSVRLTMTDNDSIVITGGSRDGFSDDAESSEEIDASLEGNPPNLLVNGGYLADALAGVDSQNVTLQLTGETSPILANLTTTAFAVMPLRSLS